VDQCLVARRSGGRNDHPFHSCAPPGRGDDRALAPAEGDEHDTVRVVAFAHHLAEVTMPADAISVARASPTWGVVLPHDALGVGTVVRHETIQGGDHVAITDVPRLAIGTDHRSVVALGTGDDFGVLRCIEVGLPTLSVHGCGDREAR
jgi:hypothetical protein